MTGIFLSLLLLSAAAVPAFAEPGWSRLPALPDREGFAGPFAGVSGGALIVAGGANFPDKKPWEGGTKIWYDTIFVLDRPDGQWRTAGRLPRPLGYGVSATHRNAVICVGGSDSTRHYADAFRIEWQGGKIVTTTLPSLPKSLANASGALVGDTLYIADGQEKPDSTEASRAAYAIDLAAAEPRWRELDRRPGAGRILPAAAAYDGAFWIAGGAELLKGDDGKAQRRYLKDAWRYDPRAGWRRIADLPYSVVAPPTPAPTDADGFYVLGGDDGSQIETPPDKHRGFLRKALRYDAKADKWLDAGEMPAASVTVPAVRWNEQWVIPGGEVRPGVRTPEVWRWAPKELRTP